MYHPDLCSPLINSIVSNDSCSGQRRPWSVCADAQSDLGHRCLHMPEGTVSHGATHMTILYKDADSAGGQNFDCNWRVLLLWPYIESFNQSLIHFEKRVLQHFPIQIYGGEIWPCCKKVEGQRRIIIWTNWVEFPSLMLYTNIQLQSFSPASVAQLDARPTVDQEVSAGSIPVGSATFFRVFRGLIMKYFLRPFSPFRYSRRAAVSFCRKKVHNTG